MDTLLFRFFGYILREMILHNNKNYQFKRETFSSTVAKLSIYSFLENKCL